MMSTGTRIIGTPENYVSTLLAIERATSGPICIASSFLSSIYFPPSSLRRFYGGTGDDHSRACDILLTRRDVAIQRRSAVARQELYEVDALRNMMVQGLVHEQESNYRIRPSELQRTLKSLLEWLASAPLEIALTTEVLPLVFTLATPSDVLIDIRANYLYQRIQGIHIHGDPRAFEILSSDFERLWATAAVGSAAARDLLARGLTQWQSGQEVDLSDWPRMRTSERR